MIALSEKELARMRSDLRTMLPDTVVLYADGGTLLNGVRQTNWQISGTINCRLDFRAGHSFVDAQTTREYSDIAMTVAYDDPLTTANLVEFGTVRYRVLSVSPDMTWRIHKEARLETYE